VQAEKRDRFGEIDSAHSLLWDIAIVYICQQRSSDECIEILWTTLSGAKSRNLEMDLDGFIRFYTDAF
jgi:hypothetical protein